VRSGDIWGHETVTCFCKHGNTFNVINFLILIENSIIYTQQNAQTFRYTILYIKRYASNVFRSVMEHLLGGNA